MKESAKLWTIEAFFKYSPDWDCPRAVSIWKFSKEEPHSFVDCSRWISLWPFHSVNALLCSFLWVGSCWDNESADPLVECFHASLCYYVTSKVNVTSPCTTRQHHDFGWLAASCGSWIWSRSSGLFMGIEQISALFCFTLMTSRGHHLLWLPSAWALSYSWVNWLSFKDSGDLLRRLKFIAFVWRNWNLHLCIASAVDKTASEYLQAFSNSSCCSHVLFWLFYAESHGIDRMHRELLIWVVKTLAVLSEYGLQHLKHSNCSVGIS